VTRARAPWRIEPLDKAHDRTGFVSGAPELDRYIRELASQDVRQLLLPMATLRQLLTP